MHAVRTDAMCARDNARRGYRLLEILKSIRDARLFSGIAYALRPVITDD